MSDKMIDYGGRKIGERPSKYSKEVADYVFDGIKSELACGCGVAIETVETWRDDFINAACHEGQDGYKMARHLDSKGWNCNRELLELFDDAPWDKAHSFFVQQWMAYWKLGPLFKVGDKVRAKHGHDTVESTIKEINGYRYPHASYKLEKIPGESSWRIVLWEDCQAVES